MDIQLNSLHRNTGILNNSGRELLDLVSLVAGEEETSIYASRKRKRLGEEEMKPAASIISVSCQSSTASIMTSVTSNKRT